MQQTFALLVTGPAYGSEQSLRALKFAQAVIDEGHTILGVFFYREGVLNANQLISPATDELNLHRSWCIFAKENNVSLHVCVSAAQRRGILDKTLAEQSGFAQFNGSESFAMSGLGQLSELLLNASRIMQF